MFPAMLILQPHLIPIYLSAVLLIHLKLTLTWIKNMDMYMWSGSHEF